MKEKYIYYSVIFVLLSFNLFLLWHYVHGEKTIPMDCLKLTGENQRLKLIISVICENQNMQLSNNLEVVDEKFDTLSLKKIIDSDKLVFYYEEFNCMPCVEETMSLLNNKIDKIGRDKAIILTCYEQPRELYLFSHINNIEIPIYNLKSKLNIPAVTINTPFLFTINNDLKINNLMLVDHTSPELVNEYLDRLVIDE